MTRVADLIAVDPGDKYTGVAFFNKDEEGRWYCASVQEFVPDEFNDAFLETLGDREEPEFLIIEKFSLYEDKAHEQTGSEFLTPQQIGVLKFVVRHHNIHAEQHQVAESTNRMTTCERPGGVCNNPDLRVPRPITLAIQPADIKKPTFGIAKSLGLTSVTKKMLIREFPSGKKDHCRDAEIHAWRYILKTLQEPYLV